MTPNFNSEAAHRTASAEPELELAGPPAAMRVLVFTEHLNATCFISFERPLRLLNARGRVTFAIASQSRVNAGGAGCWRRWMTRLQPDVVVMSRYASPHGEAIVADAKRFGAAVVYHIDDNLLDLPDSLSAGVVKTHGAAEVVQARASMLRAADLVYASTPQLASVLSARLPGQRIIHGEMYCSFASLDPAPPAVPPIIGYMGSRGHQEDLALVVPSLHRLLSERPELRFEVFGSIQMPAELAMFGERVRAHTVQKAYDEFLHILAGLGWSIGLAPLVDEPFNRCKAPTKYIEYASASIPCVASRWPVYGEAVPAKGGRLVDGDWYTALSAWLDSPEQARQAGHEARCHCADVFSLDRLALQVESVLTQAASSVSALVVLAPQVSDHPLAATVLRDTLARRTGQRVRVRGAEHQLSVPGLRVVKLPQWGIAMPDGEPQRSAVAPLEALHGVSLTPVADLTDSPWRTAGHTLGPIWASALQTMLDAKDVTPDDIRQAVKRRELRPSLLHELGLMAGSRGPLRWLIAMIALLADRAGGFRRARARAEKAR